MFAVTCSHLPPVSPPEQGVLAVWGQVGPDATHCPQAAQTGGRHQATVVRLVLVSDALGFVSSLPPVICRPNCLLVDPWTLYDKELQGLCFYTDVLQFQNSYEPLNFKSCNV